MKEHTNIGQKIRKIRVLKGFSQEYLSNELGISQKAYSKLERDETKIDWHKIEQISEILDVNPFDLVRFDEQFIFNNCTYAQNGKIENFMNQTTNDKLITSLETKIEDLKKEVEFLREMILNVTKG